MNQLHFSLRSVPQLNRRPVPDISNSTILGGTFRANPSYELVPFDRLTPHQQTLLKVLRTKDSDLFGILQPRKGSRLSLKTVCHDTANLFVSLEAPGKLPGTVVHAACDANRAVANLVLDGVLEVAPSGSSDFVSGPQAYPLFYNQATQHRLSSRTALLSVDALKYAQRLDRCDGKQLSSRLYAYNRHPASPRWLRRLPNTHAVAQHLRVGDSGPNRSTLDRYWREAAASPDYLGWRIWRWSGEGLPVRSHVRLSYKMYVSPHPEFVKDGIGEAIAAFTIVKAPAFKFGDDVYGVLRPDKIVAYFEEFDDLQEASTQLHRRLEGCSSHGVPFTAELEGDGLLSWGMDPPQEQHTSIWLKRESWRVWVTNRLATAMLAAKTSRRTSLEPWEFAIERLRVDGVDTDTWAPNAEMWRPRRHPLEAGDR